MAKPLDSLTGEPTVNVHLNLPDGLFDSTPIAEQPIEAQAPAPQLDTPVPQEAAKLPEWSAGLAQQDEDGMYGAGLMEKPKAPEAPVAAPIEGESVSAGNAFARKAVRGVVPTAAGFAAFGTGFSIGAGAGLATGPAAVVASPVLGVIGGLGTMFTAGWLANKAQDAGLKVVLGEEGYKKMEATDKKAEKEHPYASIAGEAAPQLLAFRPSLTSVKAAAGYTKMLLTDSKGAADFAATPQGQKAQQALYAIAFGSAAGGALEAAREKAINGNLQWDQIAAQTVIGGLLHKETKLGSKLTNLSFTKGYAKGEKPEFPDGGKVVPEGAITEEAVNEAAQKATPEELEQMLLPLTTNIEDHRMRGGLESAAGASPAPEKSLQFDESGQSAFDFYGDLVPSEGKGSSAESVQEPSVSAAGETPAVEPSAQPELDFSQKVGDLEGKKVKATFQGETGFLELQGDTLVLRKPRSKQVFEVGPATSDKPLSQFEGLEVVQQKQRGKAASPAETSAQVIVEQSPQKSKLESWADDTIKEAKGRLNMGVDPELLSAYAVKGAYHIARGAKTFAEWTQKMIAEFGDAVRPHLQDLWWKSQEIHQNPAKGAEAKAASDASTPVLNGNALVVKQAHEVFQKYFSDPESSAANAAQAAGILNVNTYDPAASGTKIVEAVATTIEDALRKATGEPRTLEKRAADAAQFIVDSGNADALALIKKGTSGLRADATVTAYQMLITDARFKLEAASNERLKSPSLEADRAHESAFDHYAKIMTAMKGQSAESSRGLNAFKQLKDWQKVVDAALAASNPDRAMNSLVTMNWKDLALGVAREITVGNLLSYTSASVTAFGGGVNGLVKITKQLMGARDMNMAKAAIKQYGYVVNSIGDAFENMRIAVAAHEPRFTTHTAIDETAGGAYVDRNRYSSPTVNSMRSRGFVSSESVFNTLGFDPMQNPFWAATAGVLDTAGEVVRSSNRLVLGADEFIKTAYGLAYVKSRYYHEGLLAGMEGEALEGYVKSKSDSLLLRDRTLYTKENLLRQLAQEVHSDGLVGHEAAVELETRFNKQWDNQLGAVAQEAQRYADEVSMMEPFEDGAIKDLYSWMKMHPWYTLGAGMVFFRQAINAFRQAAQQFPLLGLASKTRAKMLASGDPFQVAEAKGRDSMALALATLGAGATMGGYLTGAGPRDPEQRKLALKDGWLPWSFRIPKNSEGAKALLAKGINFDGSNKDFYFLQYSMMDPIAVPLQLFASLGDFAKEAHYDQDSDLKDKISGGVMATVLAVLDLTKEKSGMNTLKQVSKLLDQRNTQDGNKMWDAFETYLQQRGSVAIPSMASKVLTSGDTVATQAYTYLQTLAQRVGQDNFNAIGGAVGLPPVFVPRQWNILGETVDKAVTETPAVNIINPFLVSEGKDDKLIHEMLSLQHPWNAPSRYHSSGQENDVWDMREFQYNGKGKGAAPKDGQDAYDRWNELVGQTKIGGKSLRERLTDTINSPAYNALPAQTNVIKGGVTGRVDILNTTVRAYRDIAFQQVLKEYPDFNKVYQTKKMVGVLSKTQTADQTKKTLASPSFQKVLDFYKPTK